MNFKNLIKKFIPDFLISFYHFFLAFLSAVIYRFPSREIFLIGVTGTNGKTTTTELITQLLEKAGYKVALLNSYRFKIGGEGELNRLRMTMPGRFFIQKFLRKAVKEKCNFAVLEVTSEGIKQHRHRFLKFRIAVFLNLAPEHIEAHGSFEKYREAKGKLFEATKDTHIINIENEHAPYYLKFPAKKKITFGLERGDFNLKNTKLKLKVLGDFNYYNALAAFAVGSCVGIEKEISLKALEEFEGVPGRMEVVIKEPFVVIVDYAFTPFALEEVYQTIKKTFSPKRQIAILGAAGGGRDKWKRPVLGEIAARYSDIVFVTNEDPYDDDPWEIIEQVAKGAENISINQHKSVVRKILDRREAIKEALKEGKKGDVIVITGKGCEPSICEKGKRIPWDEKKVVKEEFEKLYGKERTD